MSVTARVMGVLGSGQRHARARYTCGLGAAASKFRPVPTRWGKGA